jgi:hypothetical protein
MRCWSRPDLRYDASELLPVIKSLDGSLNAVAREASRLPHLRHRPHRHRGLQQRRHDRKLNQALTVEIIFVAAFIGLAFRSVTVMLVSILPGIFPILASGAVLWLLGDGLQFAASWRSWSRSGWG